MGENENDMQIMTRRDAEDELFVGNKIAPMFDHHAFS